MIRKLKRRYFISNMALLSATLLIGLGILFGILYRSEVSSSYSTMSQMIERSDLPENSSIEGSLEPTAYSYEDYTEGGYNYNQKPTNPYNPYIPPQNEWWNGNPDNYWNPNYNTQETTPPEELNQNAEYTQPAQTSDTTETVPAETALGEAAQEQYHWGEYYEHFMGPNTGTPPMFWTMTPPVWNPQFSDNQNSEDSSDAVVTEQTTVSDNDTTVTTEETTAVKVAPEKKNDGKANAKSDDKVKPAPADIKDKPAANEENKQPPTPPTNPKKEAPKTIDSNESANAPKEVPDAFVARIDENGNIEAYAIAASILAEDETPSALNTVNEAMNFIKSQGGKSGTIQLNDIDYRYLYQQNTNGEFHLVLLNRTMELSAISRLMFLFLFLTVIGLLGVFIVSELLANWTVKPIATAWEKQKQFVADASHELKTPLAVISANTEVILSNPSASVQGQSKWIHYIQSETTRMSKLISNLLSIARMDHKKSTDSTTLLQCSDLVSNVCLVFEPIAFENGKTLNTDIRQGLQIRGDEDNLKQLLSILLDNAVIHSSPNAEITVQLAKDALGKVRLTVANTAKDIPQDQLEHLFDRFYRLDTEGNPNGSGLGLSIAKSIVQQMGGTLTATSENNLVAFTALI